MLKELVLLLAVQAAVAHLRLNPGLIGKGYGNCGELVGAVTLSAPTERFQ